MGPAWPALKRRAAVHKLKRGSASVSPSLDQVGLLVDQDVQLAFLLLKNLLDRLNAIPAGHVHL
jgi:hypothetical protein